MQKNQLPVAAEYADARDRVLADFRADKIARGELPPSALEGIS